MKTQSILAAASLTALISTAGSVDAGLSIYPKNLARHHMGSNLMVFNDASQSFVPTDSAAAWLDDDITTGASVQTGHHFYLLALAEPQLVNNFSVSTEGGSGTVSLFASDEPAKPESPTWKALAKDVDLSAISQKKLEKPFSRLTKYILIETNVQKSAPWYGLYLYGEKPSVAYHLQKRSQDIDPRAIFGSNVNVGASISLSSLYTQSRVTYVNAGSEPVAWNRIIDDNSGSLSSSEPAQSESGIVLKYGNQQSIHRVALLTEKSAKGKLEFFLVSNPAKEGTPIDIANSTPIATIAIDNGTNRVSADFPPVKADQLLVRWTPEIEGQPLAISELNSFGDVTLASYELAPDGIAEYTHKSGKDGKDSKDMPPPVGEGPADPVGEAPKTPFIPGTPPFPPDFPVSP